MHRNLPGLWGQDTVGNLGNEDHRRLVFGRAGLPSAPPPPPPLGTLPSIWTVNRWGRSTLPWVVTIVLSIRSGTNAPRPPPSWHLAKSR